MAAPAHCRAGAAACLACHSIALSTCRGLGAAQLLCSGREERREKGKGRQGEEQQQIDACRAAAAAAAAAAAEKQDKEKGSSGNGTEEEGKIDEGSRITRGETRGRGT